MRKMNTDRLKVEVGELREKFKTFGSKTTLEMRANYTAAEILLRLLDQQPISEEQIKFLKEQSIDFSKVLTLIGLQVVTGSSVAILLLEKIGKRHGFTLFPKPNKSVPDMK